MEGKKKGRKKMGGIMFFSPVWLTQEKGEKDKIHTWGPPLSFHPTTVKKTAIDSQKLVK